MYMDVISNMRISSGVHRHSMRRKELIKPNEKNKMSEEVYDKPIERKLCHLPP